MFMGDYRQDAPWSTDSLKGCKRFIDKIIRVYDKVNNEEGFSKDLELIQNKTIKSVTNDLETMGYNTYISSLMILTNAYDDKDSITKEDYRLLLGYKPLCEDTWPTYDESKLVEKNIDIAVQVNGKVRSTININIDEDEDSIKEKALKEENVQKHIEGKEIVKIIVIKGKIVNIVVK